MCVCEIERVCVCACTGVRAYVRACVCVCVRERERICKLLHAHTNLFGNDHDKLLHCMLLQVI